MRAFYLKVELNSRPPIFLAQADISRRSEDPIFLKNKENSMHWKFLMSAIELGRAVKLNGSESYIVANKGQSLVFSIREKAGSFGDKKTYTIIFKYNDQVNSPMYQAVLDAQEYQKIQEQLKAR